jgi:hypothetical protein
VIETSTATAFDAEIRIEVMPTGIAPNANALKAAMTAAGLSRIRQVGPERTLSFVAYGEARAFPAFAGRAMSIAGVAGVTVQRINSVEKDDY